MARILGRQPLPQEDVAEMAAAVVAEDLGAVLARTLQGVQRTLRKKTRMSSTSSCGCSSAAKCPPCGISVQWIKAPPMFRSTQARRHVDLLGEERKAHRGGFAAALELRHRRRARLVMLRFEVDAR